MAEGFRVDFSVLPSALQTWVQSDASQRDFENHSKLAQ